MKTVKLITCDDAFQAHIIQGALANEGIDSLLHNENMSTLLRVLSMTSQEWMSWWRIAIMKQPCSC